MDPELTTSGPQQVAAAAASVAGSIRLLTSNLVIPGMKMEFPGPPPGYGHGFGPPTILDLSPRSVDHPPSIQSPYTPGQWSNGTIASFLVKLMAEKTKQRSPCHRSDTLWFNRATRSRFGVLFS